MGVDASLTGVPLFDSLEIVKVMDIDVHKLPSTEFIQTTTAHNLGFSPIAIGFMKLSTLYYPLPFLTFTTNGASSGKLQSYYYFWVDGTNITAGIDTPDWSGNGGYTSDITSTYRIYLLRSTSQPT